jgi:PAS domain S-box-containing protein
MEVENRRLYEVNQRMGKSAELMPELTYAESKHNGDLHKPHSGVKKSAITSIDGFIHEVMLAKQTAGPLGNREVLDLVIGNIPGVVFKGYINGSIEFFNNKVEEITGYSKTYFESDRRKWTDLIIPEDMEKVRRAFIQALKTNDSYVREYRIRNKKKKIVWVQERSHIVCDQNGNVEYVSGMLFNITPRKQAEKALQEGEGFLSSIFSSIQDGISVVNLDLRIVQVNPTMEKWYQHALPLVGKKCYQAYHNQDIPCRPCPACRTIATGKPQFETLARKGKNGNTSGWLEVYTFPWLSMSNGRIKGVIKYVRDITYRVQAQETIDDNLIKLKKSLNGTVNALANATETRDPYTAGHQRRVVQLACAIAHEMKVSQVLEDGLRVMGFLHDIGKIAIPAEILSKPSRLSEVEFNLIKDHPQAGYNIIKDIEFPWPVAEAVLQHHERLDGSGYPRGLVGREIMVEARILAVADVIEAIASHRPYRPALGIDKALEEVSQHKGILYDAKVVEACVKLFNESGFVFE